MTTTTKFTATAAVIGGVLAAATSASAALNLPTQFEKRYETSRGS
jgi:hypothetical protein